MTVRLVIDRLVLDGVDLAPAERGKLVAAMQAQIAQAVAEQGMAAALASGGAVHRLTGAHISLPHGVGGSELGSRLAGALCATLTEAER